MKIISKYKDFYDHFIQDIDSDLIYIRKPYFIDENYNKLIPKYIGSYYKYFNWRSNNVDIKQIVFGIYPYVYSQPYIKIEEDIILLNKEHIDYISSHKEKEGKEYINNILKKYKLKYNGYLNKDLEYYLWKIECKDIFHKLNSPLFLYINTEVFDIQDLKFIKNSFQDKHLYICDVIFNMLPINVINYWRDEIYDLNTYINIENFLWSTKQEPESIPDNKTKILSHGFDLKESFRNIK